MTNGSSKKLAQTRPLLDGFPQALNAADFQGWAGLSCAISASCFLLRLALLKKEILECGYIIISPALDLV